MQFPGNEAPTKQYCDQYCSQVRLKQVQTTHYSNIERDALGILQSLEKFQHYCFTNEVNMITDHKQLVASYKTYVASLSQAAKNII